MDLVVLSGGKMSNIDLVLEDVKNGKPVIIVDDSQREDEGDVVLAAEKCDEYNLAFCMLHARGLMCLSMTRSRVEGLGIPPMPTNNLDALQTPFCCPVDAVEGTTTGMSVGDRLKTISVVLDDDHKPNKLHYPGHMQILKARDGLLDERKGHTESSVALVLLAGLKPVAMIQEIINTDGTMAKEKDIKTFAKTYGLRVVSVQEIDEASKQK